MPRHAYVTVVSQLYHGELATLAMCRHLKDRIYAPAEREALEG